MAGFSHVALGSNDLDRSASFYGALLAPLGWKVARQTETSVVLSDGEGGTLLLLTPKNGEPASHANGGTVGFAAESRPAVDAFHAAGLANGGTCEGEPGPRAFPPTAYGAYVRDPDGNKLCTFCYAPA